MEITARRLQEGFARVLRGLSSARDWMHRNLVGGDPRCDNPAYPNVLCTTWTGSLLDIGLQAEFESEPAPHTDDVNDAQGWIWLHNGHYFLSNLSAIIGICGSELADVEQVELEHAKETIREDYVNGQLVANYTTNRTVDSRLSDMTEQELEFLEVALAACGNLTDIGDVTDGVFGTYAATDLWQCKSSTLLC